MADGFVTIWNDLKGYGILEASDGSRVYVHSSDILADGFKTLREGQRVSFEVESTPKGERARKVVPSSKIEVDVTPEEWEHLGPHLKEQRIEAAHEPYLDSWDRAYGKVTIDVARHDEVVRFLDGLKPRLKAARPANPVYVLFFASGDEGEVACAAGAATPEAAERLARAHLARPETLRKLGLEEAAFEIVETMTLEEYEEGLSGLLPRHSHPAPGAALVLSAAL